MLNRNVPRYTSYPTAPHFNASVGPAVYRSWLAALGADAPLSLYLHVPFCAQLCLYCGCNTKVTLRRPPIEAYAGRLVKEIGLVAGATGRRPVQQEKTREDRLVRHVGQLLALLAAIAAAALVAQAQAADDYPTRPIVLVIPLPPAGTTDIMARAVTDKMSAALGQRIVIENRNAGASGTVGTRESGTCRPRWLHDHSRLYLDAGDRSAYFQ